MLDNQPPAPPDSCLQPFAGLLPHTVMQPGRVVGAVTRQAAEQFGLRKDCLVCAGTSGESCCEGQTCLPAGTMSTAFLRRPVHMECCTGGMLAALTRP